MLFAFVLRLPIHSTPQFSSHLSPHHVCSFHLCSCQALRLTENYTPLPGGDKLQFATFTASRNIVCVFVNGFIEFPMAPSVAESLSSGFTVEFLFRVHEEYNASTPILRCIRKDSNVDQPTIELRWGIEGEVAATDGEISICSGGIVDTTEKLCCVEAQVGEWNHLAFTVSDENVLNLYLNGKLASTIQLEEPLSSYLFNHVILGKLNVDSLFTMRMREFRVWKKVRSVDDIRSYMKRELVLPNPDLAQYFKLADQDPGTRDGHFQAPVDFTTLTKNGSAQEAQLPTLERGRMFPEVSTPIMWFRDTSLKVSVSTSIRGPYSCVAIVSHS